MSDTQERISQPSLPFVENERQLDRYQRLDTLSRLEGGFLPVTRAEQTEVMGLVAEIDRPGGAARHLNEVNLHQQKADTLDPLRAVRRIVREYGGYARDAQQASGQLTHLHQDLRDVLNPELHLDRVIEPTHPGVLPFLRFFDLMTLRDERRIDKIGYDPQKVSYTPDNGALVQVYVPWALESWTVHQVRGRLPEALENEAHRKAFWMERLVEVERHSPKQVRAVAKDELDKIHGRTAS